MLRVKNFITIIILLNLINNKQIRQRLEVWFLNLTGFYEEVVYTEQQEEDTTTQVDSSFGDFIRQVFTSYNGEASTQAMSLKITLIFYKKSSKYTKNAPTKTNKALLSAARAIVVIWDLSPHSPKKVMVRACQKTSLDWTWLNLVAQLASLFLGLSKSPKVSFGQKEKFILTRFHIWLRFFLLGLTSDIFDFSFLMRISTIRALD